MKNKGENKKPLTFLGHKVTYILNLYLLFGVIGWVLENIVISIGKGVIDARYHFLPIIPAYGLIVFAGIILIGSTNDFAIFGKHLFKQKSKKTIVLSNIVSFVLICAIVFVAELAIGNFWNSCFGVALWDYSSLPLHITQFTSIVPTIGYGIFGYVMIALINPTLRFMERHLSCKASKIINWVLFPLYIIDDLQLYIMMIFFNKASMVWSIALR